MKDTYNLADDIGLAEGYTLTAIEASLDGLGGPKVPSKMTLLFAFLIVPSNQQVVVHGVDEFGQKSLYLVLTEFQHVLQTVTLKVTNNFQRLSQMGFTLKSAKKAQTAIFIEAGLALLTQLLGSLLITLADAVFVTLPLVVGSGPGLGLSQEILFQLFFVGLDLSSQYFGSIGLLGGHFDVGDGSFDLKSR